MILVALTGVIAAVLLAACKSFFFLAHRVIPYSFSENLIYYITRESLIPAIVICVLYFLISRDDFDFKLKSVFPLEAGFYTVYLPYCVLNSDIMNYSIYPVLLKPVIYGAMIVQIGLSISIISNKTENKIRKIISGGLLVIYLVLPALFDAFYCIDNKTIILILAVILIALIPFGYIVFTFIKEHLLK